MGFMDFFKDDEAEDEGRVPLRDPIDEAKAMIDEERFDEAVVECEKALISDPRAAAAMALKGLALARLASRAEDTEKFGEALGFVDQAAACNPNDPIVREVREMIDGVFREAEGSSHDPLVGDLLLNAEMLLEMDHGAEAVMVCDRALKICPKCAAALALKAYARGRLAKTNEEMGAAHGLLDEANAIDATDPRAKRVTEFFKEVMDQAGGAN